MHIAGVLPDCEIDVAWLEKNPEIKEVNIKPQVDQFVFPGRQQLHLLRKRAPREPRLRQRAPVVRHVVVVLEIDKRQIAL